MPPSPLPDDDLGTQERLLTAAAKVFVRRGFAGATVREIAEAAGFTNPVLYYHFGSKQRVYEATIAGAFERFEKLTGEALAAGAGPVERLQAYAGACLEFARLDPIRLRLIYQEIFHPLGSASTEIDARMQKLRASSRSRIEELIAAVGEAGVVRVDDVGLAARLFNAALGGLLMEQARDPDEPLATADLAKATVDVFLRGFGGLQGGAR